MARLVEERKDAQNGKARRVSTPICRRVPTLFRDCRAMRIPLSTLKSREVKGKWKLARQQRYGITLDASIEKAKLLIVDKLMNVFNGAAPFESEVVYATVKAGRVSFVVTG